MQTPVVSSPSPVLQGGVVHERVVVPDWMVGTWRRETAGGEMDRRVRTLDRVMVVPRRTVTEQKKTWTIFLLTRLDLTPVPGGVELRSSWRAWTVDKRSRRVTRRDDGEQVEICRPGPGVDEMTVEAEAIAGGVVSRWRSVDRKIESASPVLDR